MPKASKSLQKRKRGGQPGHRNRRTHGSYTGEEAARRVELRAYRRKGRALVILVDNVLKARKALKRKRAAFALAAAAHATPSPSSRPKTVGVQQRKNTARCSSRRAAPRRSSRSPPPSQSLHHQICHPRRVDARSAAAR
jgi:hypothetical protein